MDSNRGYHLSISMLHPVVHYIVLRGFKLEQFCEYASLDIRILQDSEARIKEEELDRLLDAAAIFTQDEHLGLHLGQTIQLSNLGILGYVLLNCRTIEEALVAFRRYNVILCSGIDIEWETAGEELFIHFKLRNPERQPSRHAVEGIVSSLYHIIHKLSYRHSASTQLSFAHDGSDKRGIYLSLFGVEPKFYHSINRLCLQSEVLQYPILASNQELLSTFEAYAEECRNKLLYGQTFADQVFKWITQCIPSTFPDVKDAAQYFNVSVRTLQANLKQEQTTYNILFNRARKELAIHYLKEPRFTVSEVAYLLQFSEPSAFHSAFKRWTGIPPGQYRGKSI